MSLVITLVNLVYVQFVQVNSLFFVVNMFLLFAIPQIISKIKNKQINILMSILSILIWSICIDIFSYYLFPLFKISNSIFSYVFNGIMFNLKFVMLNTFFLIVIYLVDVAIPKGKLSSKNYYLIYKKSICKLS